MGKEDRIGQNVKNTRLVEMRPNTLHGAVFFGLEMAVKRTGIRAGKVQVLIEDKKTGEAVLSGATLSQQLGSLHVSLDSARQLNGDFMQEVDKLSPDLPLFLDEAFAPRLDEKLQKYELGTFLRSNGGLVACHFFGEADMVRMKEVPEEAV